MKKITKSKKIVLILILFVTSYVFIQYGTISPILDITGCYEMEEGIFTDRICLYKSGKYEQFSILGGNEVKYNDSEWRSFPYSNDEGNFIAGTLARFKYKDSSGNLIKVLELDIQPHQNTFGKVIFAIGKNKNLGKRRVYLRRITKGQVL